MHTGSTADIVVDASRTTRISPYIYGVNYPNNWIYDWFDEWRKYNYAFTFARQSGNRFTAYNWETNASNAGKDYFHENDDYLARSNEPGWTVRHFLRLVQDAGAAALITVQTQGHVSADKITEMHGSKDVGKTPDYINTRYHRSYATKPGRKPSYPPDTTDKAVYLDEFVTWVEKVKSNKTPVWFTLDNEPDWWQETHARIQTQKSTYASIFANHIEYATMIKSIAPDTLIFGPANYGWAGMRDFQGAADANGRFFVDTYLATMRDAERKARKRLLDVYDFHFYSEVRGEGVRINSNEPDKPGTGPARIQAPRSLWDPNFVEASWITSSLGDKPIRMIPMMQEKIAKNYPGTKLSITEYDFGGRNTISGAIAQADSLGIFGRYGLFAANHWGLRHTDRPAFAAFQSFTNYDRKGGRFGDLGLAVAGETPAENSIYASLDSKNRKRMTVVLINKTTHSAPMSVLIKGFKPKSVQSYIVAEGAYDQPGTGSATIENDRLTVTLPPLSIVTAEILAR